MAGYIYEYCYSPGFEGPLLYLAYNSCNFSSGAERSGVNHFSEEFFW